jgi:hypothetical protein
VGAKGEWLTRREWLDAFIEHEATMLAGYTRRRV